MSAELFKSLAYFLTGGFLIFLAITITRDNFTNRLNRVTGGMLLFAGLGPVFMAMGKVIGQSTTSGAFFVDSPVYNLYYIWELFYPFLLIFSWAFPVDRFRLFKHPRFQFMIFIPQIMHLVLVLFFDQIVGFFDILKVRSCTWYWCCFLIKSSDFSIF